MEDYYARNLSGLRLRLVYETAPPPVKRYLQAEIDYLSARLKSGDLLLELGCGYGRILRELAASGTTLFGIDTATGSLGLVSEYLGPDRPVGLAAMNAVQLGFRSDSFDKVACLQNGISAFRVDQELLIKEALRVTRPGGLAVFSSYADHFWPERLAWFRIQSEQGLIGEIDETATGRGIIVCRDGFRATTIGPDDFQTLVDRLGLEAEIEVLAEGAVMCVIQAP